MPTAPVLETDRLILRGHRVADAEDCAAIWAQEAVVRHITGRPATREESWARLLRYIGHWVALDFGYWAVIERATGRFIGEAGFADFRRALDPPFGAVPEAGWVFTARAHGHGLAGEAMGRILAWADEERDWSRTVCMIAPDNVASSRLADRLGYRRYARTRYRDEPTDLLERVRVTR